MVINKPSYKVFDDIMKDWRTQLIIKKLTDTMLPDGWVYCMQGNHFVKKEKALMGNFHNPVEGKKETCYFCYKHLDQVNLNF